MQTIKILYGHELADLVGEEQLFEAADLNDISITEVLSPGIVLSIPSQQRAQLISETIPQPAKPITLKALAGQTWVDIVLQQLGNEHRLFELCDKNNSGITEDINPGTVIQSPEFEATKKAIVSVLKATLPASDLTVQPGEPEPEGIEFWAIEFEFVVS